jgi:hypothetical protein
MPGWQITLDLRPGLTGPLPEWVSRGGTPATGQAAPWRRRISESEDGSEVISVKFM